MTKSFVQTFKTLKIKITSNSKGYNDSCVVKHSLKIDDSFEFNKENLNIEDDQQSQHVIVSSPNELLFLSCAYGNVALMGYSLALNAERNSILEKKDVNACDNLANIPIIKKIRINGYTPLISAVHSGSIIAVEFLLLNGSKLNACDFNGQTALHHATILKDLK